MPANEPDEIAVKWQNIQMTTARSITPVHIFCWRKEAKLSRGNSGLLYRACIRVLLPQGLVVELDLQEILQVNLCNIIDNVLVV